MKNKPKAKRNNAVAPYTKYNKTPYLYPAAIRRWADGKTRASAKAQVEER